MLMKIFRYIALFEGITTIALFLIAMPLKYGFGNDVLISPFGRLHGYAVVIYLVTLIVAFAIHRIGPLGWLRSFAAAMIPFGTFVNDPWVKRQEERVLAK